MARSPEAKAAYQAITSDPDFDSLPVAEKQQVLKAWKAKYDPPRQPVTLSKEPPKGPMRLVQNGKVVETPNQMVPKPLLPQRRELPAPQKQGPPTPTLGSNVPVINELLHGMVASPSRTAPASQGRPTLPPEFEQGLQPSSGGMLSMLQPFVENVVPQFALQASPLGPFLGPIVANAGVLSANYGTQINNGQLSREDAQRNLGTDLAGLATMGPLNKLLPGNGLLQAATRNTAQSVVPAELDEAVTGRMQDPLMMAVGMGLGAAADVYTGQSPNMAPVKQAINDAVAPPRVAQAGMAVADDASFGGVFRKGDEPPTGGVVPVEQTLTRADLVAQREALSQEHYRLEQQRKEPGAWLDNSLNSRLTELRKGMSSIDTQLQNMRAPKPEAATPPPPRPPIDTPSAGPAAPPPDPQRGPITAEVVGPAAPRPTDPVPPQPQPGQFPDPKPTPEMQRVFGADANNLRGEARQVIKDVARAVDNPPRPASDPARVAQVREIVDRTFNKRKGFLRSDKLSGMSDEAQNNLLTRAAEVVVEEGLDPKAVIGFDVIRRRAADVSPEVLRDLKKGEEIPAGIYRAAMETIDSNSQAIQALEGRILEARNGGDVAGAKAMESELSVLENDTKRLLAITIPAGSQYGRNLAYMKIVNKGNFNESYWQARAARAAGTVDMDNATITKVRDLTLEGQRLQAAGDTKGADGVRIELAKLLAGLEKTSPLSAFTNTIRAGLLSSPTTHLINMTGNGLNLMVEGAARVPASIADSFLGMFTGKRTVQGLNAHAIIDAGKAVRTNGWKEFKEILANGATLDELKKFELPREQNTGLRVLDAYVNGSFRLLGAEDRLFRSYAVRRSLSEQADLLARQATKDASKAAKASGDPFDARDFYQTKRQELIDKPSDAMQAQAVGDAEYATFQGDNLLSAFVSGGKRVVAETGVKMDNKFLEKTGIESKGGQFAAEVMNTATDLTMPFVKTPSNVVMNLLDLTGAGGVMRGVGGVGGRALKGAKDKAILKELTRALNPAEQRAIAQAVGRGAVGWALMALGGYLQQKGIMTGKYDKNEKGLKGTNQLVDMQEGALNIGGRSIGIARLTPPGALMTLGATLMQDGGDISNVGTQALSIVSEMPMMQGAKQLSDVIDNPKAMGGRMASNYAGMVVPNLINKVGAMTDSVERQAYDQNASVGSNAARAVAARLPGLRQTLPAKTDPFGRSIPQNRAAIVDFTNSRAINPDPMAQELRRAGVEVKQPKPEQRVTDEFTGEERTVKLTPAQMQQVKATTGALAREELEIFLGSADYADMSPTERKTEIEKIIAYAQTEARGMLEEQLLTGESVDPGVPVPSNSEAAGAAFWGSR